MVLYSPDWTGAGFSFILLTVNLFCHSMLIDQGLYPNMQVHNKNSKIQGRSPNAGFQVGPTFPNFPTFPYFFDLLLLFPTFS